MSVKVPSQFSQDASQVSVHRRHRGWIDATAGTSATSGTRIIVVSTTTGGSMAGSAAKAAVKGLKKKRVTATRGEDFTVTDVPGPLAAGEKERARAWARTLL